MERGINRIATDVERLLRDEVQFLGLRDRSSLKGDPLDDLEAYSLADAIGGNSKLKMLNLSRCLDGGKHPVSVLALLKAIMCHPSLSVLEFGDSNFTAAHVATVAEGLERTGSNLKALLIYGDMIQDEGAKSLARALTINTTLERLFLCDKSIDAEGVQAIAEVVDRISLKYLNLSGNELGDGAVIKLAEALTENRSIEELFLDRNGITDAACRPLARTVLARNDRLSRLEMTGNRITVSGASALDDALVSVNYSLTLLNLGSHDGCSGGILSGEQQGAIDRRCEINLSLKLTYEWIGKNFAIMSASPGLWPAALALAGTKPDYLYRILRAKPDLCRERRKFRRRSRPSS